MVESMVVSVEQSDHSHQLLDHFIEIGGGADPLRLGSVGAFAGRLVVGERLAKIGEHHLGHSVTNQQVAAPVRLLDQSAERR